ncbi:M67 family peptidase [Noviherbaspirillum cavernae]|uniref:M67 family peptidase n=1 Tax=Noviherbaspirillum cavernae TaxID=2320862 RepID=A0A418X2I4_9BURK|nr:M67 family metallopeptidase [Noviherbaspirillum cavernae]RJG06650.1 M67 family peptidase [Noviherbaspirillum cavernae]
MATLHMPGAFRDSLAQWARTGYPNECCGLLIGERDHDDGIVRRVTQAANLNVERARDRYLLDPQDFIAADEAARAQGMEVLGVWHTHPDHPALPSEADREAAWPNWSYVILEVSCDGVLDLRAWRLNEAQAFDEEAIQS